MNTDNIPLGERALRSVLDHVIAVGDEAETSYLEVKSELDLTTTQGVAKVAKFLLGASNRRPKEAARHFQGYAVLVIGAQKGNAGGVARGVEAHELEDRLRPYLGPQFPAFEFGRIAVNAEREVLFVIAQPPQDGQSIFPCHKSFQGEKRQDNLEDGAIYVRGASNTRPARAGEVLALAERARGVGKSPISLDIEVLGLVNRVDRVDEVMGKLYDFEEERFTKPRPLPKEPHPAVLSSMGVLGRSKPLSDEDRAKRLETWKRERASNIKDGREHFLGVALPGTGIRVISPDRFVAKPHLIVTFHNCEVFDHYVVEDADFKKVVEPVVRQRDPYGPGFDPSSYRFSSRDYPVGWNNCGTDVEITITPESFRPNVPWTSDQDDYVLLVRDPQATTVSMTWVLTEDGNDTTAKGELEVVAGELVDAADLFTGTFFNNA